MGKQKKRLVKRSTLVKVLEDISGYENWLISDAYATVGDFAETVALLLGPDRIALSPKYSNSIDYWMKNEIAPMNKQPEQEHIRKVGYWWKTLSQNDCFVVTKLLTGGLRVGVSNNILARALSESFGIAKDVFKEKYTFRDVL